MSTSSTTGLQALLTPAQSVLLLIDHQPFQFANLNSHEPTMIVNNVIALAKTAKAFGIPTVLTTVVEERGGLLIQGLRDVVPDQEPINRTFINAWEDERVVDAVEATGRKKLIIAGLWTEMCVAMPTIQALGDGYEVYFVTDASGGVTREAHDMAVRRMVQAGGVPVTWMAVVGELQRDWARQETVPGVAEVLAHHGGGTGIAFAWEMQLLATPAPEPMTPASEQDLASRRR
jgi:nicotinamidase-related amidase